VTKKLPESTLLDSSVVLKWFRKDEIWRETASQLRQAYLDGHMLICVPDLLIYEIANVLRYKPDLTQRQVQEALASLYDMQIRIIEISHEVVKQAIHLAYFHDITVYDAIFVATAESLNIPFITADDKLSEKLAVVPFVQHISFFM
jgi:predicted nucleic acid-binding protein